jgi:hypothetical protein
MNSVKVSLIKDKRPKFRIPRNSGGSGGRQPPGICNYYNEEICGHLGESHVILAPRFLFSFSSIDFNFSEILDSNCPLYGRGPANSLYIFSSQFLGRRDGTLVEIKHKLILIIKSRKE